MKRIERADVNSSERSEMDGDSEQQARTIPSRLGGAVMLGLGLSGMAALIYEVAWTRQLSMVFTSTVYALSIMLASFMAGLALGGWLGGKWADTRRLGSLHAKEKDSATDLVSDLSAIEFGIGVLGLVSVLLVAMLPPIQYAFLNQFDLPPAAFFAFQMALAFLVMLAPTTLMGATLPIATKVVVRSYGTLGSTLGLLYSFNTIGAVAGSLLAGFVLIPLAGVRATVIVAACVNLGVSLMLLIVTKRQLSRRVMAAGATLVLLGGAVIALPEPAFPLSFGVSGRYNDYREYLADVRGMKTLFEDENEYSRVAVLETSFGRKFLVNGSLTEGSDALVDRATTSVLSLLPYAYAKEPRRALVIGLGTGITSQAMLSLPVDSVATVEINRAVPDAARLFIGDEPFNDERFSLAVTDARGLLQRDAATYDIITSEPSWPLASAVSPLFTKQFYEVARSRLEPGGVFTQWAPQYLLPKEDFMTLFKTFDSVFPGAQVWWITENGEETGDLFIVGTKEGTSPPVQQVEQTVRELLGERGLGAIALSPAPFDEVLEQARTDSSVQLNTDDKPVLEFHIPWELARKVSDDLKN